MTGPLTFSRREMVLAVLVAAALWAWAVVELLSPFQALNRPLVIFSWIIFLITGVVIHRRVFGAFQTSRRLSFSGAEVAALAAVLLIVVITGVLALAAPPNTWDGLTYHMGRVVHWVQNGTVAPYPTHIPRQVFSNPGFEYLLAHAYLLGGGDGFVNFVQWGAMAGSLLAVTLIARELGASRRGQIWAVLIAATIPMGIVEASSVQGDYATAFFLAVAALMLLRWRQDRSTIRAVLFAGAAALAVFTKGTGAFFIIPLLVWFGAMVLSDRFRRGFFQAGIVLGCILMVNSGFVLRNMAAFPGESLADVTTESRTVLNDGVGPDILAANLVRGAAVHWGMAWEDLNVSLTGMVRSLVSAVRVDIDNPRATFGETVFRITKPTRDENQTSAGGHLFLALAAFIAAMVWRRGGGPGVQYWWCLLAMTIIFCLAVRWQLWISRLQLPLFVLAAAGIGVFLEQRLSVAVQRVIVVMLFAMSLPYVINAFPRNLLGKKSIFRMTREERYFAMERRRYPDYTLAVDRLARSPCRNIGLVTGGNDWEYPLWPMLRARSAPGDKPWRIEHVGLRGAFARVPYPLGDFLPCVVLEINGPEVRVRDGV